LIPVGVGAENVWVPGTLSLPLTWRFLSRGGAGWGNSDLAAW